MPVFSLLVGAARLADRYVIPYRMLGGFGEGAAVRGIGCGDAPVPLGLRGGGRTGEEIPRLHRHGGSRAPTRDVDASPDPLVGRIQVLVR